MKNTILASSIAGVLMLGANSNANASDTMATNQLIDRVNAEEQYRARVNSNIKGIVDMVTPEGIEFKKFDNRITIANGTQEGVKVGTISRGLYVPLFRDINENGESALHLGVGQRISVTQGLVNTLVKDKTVEVQLRYSVRF